MKIKKLALILSPFVLILLMATPLYLQSSLSAPKTVAATPKEAIQTFLAAVQNQDADAMIGIVRDDDYVGDFAFQRTDYEQGFKGQPLASVNILSEKQLDANTSEYLIELVSPLKNPVCPQPPIPIKVIRDETSDDPNWKVWLQNWDLNCNKNSPQFGQLTFNPHSRGPRGFWEQAEHLFKTTLNIK